MKHTYIVFFQKISYHSTFIFFPILRPFVFFCFFVFFFFWVVVVDKKAFCYFNEVEGLRTF